MTLDERLVDLLMRAEDLRAEGVAVSPEELCRDCPELLADVERLLQGTGAVEQLLHAPECAAADPPSEAVVPTRPGPTVPHVPDYEILGELGRGGMGVVYKARHVALGRIVALKVIRAGAHASPEELARFQREAEAAAQLSHPNIVQVYQVGASDGLPYCALEYVEGETLAQRLGRGPLPPREAASLVEALARAAHLAHSRNVVHRDLKPANILLAAGGVATVATPQEAIPKITDFGLARRLDDEGGQTQTGAIVGTPTYMAPEQTSGQRQAVGPAADVYALGNILYECLTGRPPFEGSNALDILEQVRHREPVPPSQVQRPVPRDLETICLKCLRKEPEKRYGSAQELADDLGRFLRGEPVAARPIGSLERLAKWARRRPAVAALLAVLLVLGPAVIGLAIAAKVREQDAQLARLQQEERARLEEDKRRLEEDRQKSRDAEARVLMTRTDALGHNPRGPDDVEREALWMLTQDRDDFQRHFFERLLNQEGGPERLGRRAEAAVRAGVRFDTGRRDALAALLKDKLADDPKAPALVRLGCAEIAATLRAPSTELTGPTCRALLDEMKSPLLAPTSEDANPGEFEVNEEHDELVARDAHTVAVLASALDPDRAAEYRTEAALRLVERMRGSPSEVLGRTLAELAEQLPPDSALRVIRAILDRPVLYDSGQAAERAITALTHRLTPEEADRCIRLFLEKHDPGNHQPALAMLVKRLTPDQAARFARLALDQAARQPDKPAEMPAPSELWLLLPDLIQRLRPEQTVLIAEAVFPRAPANPEQFRQWSNERLASALAERLPPEQAARWAAHFIDRVLAPGEMHLSPPAVELVEKLTGPLPPPRAAELCGRLADVILEEMPRSQDPNPLLNLLARLGPRLAPEQASRTACVVLDLMERAGKVVASRPRPAPDQPSPALDARYRLNRCANTLSRLARVLPAEQSSDVCAAALRNLLRNKLPDDSFEEWTQVLGDLTERLTPQPAEAVAIEAVVKLAEGDFYHDPSGVVRLSEGPPPDLRAHVAQILARVAGRLSPEAAARLFPEVLRRLDAPSGPPIDTPGGPPAEELDQRTAERLSEALAALAGRLTPEKTAAQVPHLVSRVKQLRDESHQERLGDRAFLLRVRPLTSLAALLPPDTASALAESILDQMNKTTNERTLEQLSQELVRLGERLPPERLDETARTLIAVLARSGGSGPLNEGARLSNVATLTGESGRAATYTRTLIGLAGRLSPERASEGARVLMDRIARTLPPAHPPRPEPGTPEARAPGHDGGYRNAREQWRNLSDVYHEGLAALVPRAGDQALVDLLKSPDCVERRSDLVRGALEKRLGVSCADPWEMAAWLRQHRPDLDLDTPPQRLTAEDQR
jgi:hypothetical protein